MSNYSVWPIDKTQSGATTLRQSRPGSDGNGGVLRIPQSSSITAASLSDCLITYIDTRWRVFFYSSAEMQSVYFIATADWAKLLFITTFDYRFWKWTRQPEFKP